jgi:predicted RNA-binding protein with RPS1 domain
MQEDFLYLDDGVVKISDMAMQIPEFKELKRYDTSLNKIFFHNVLSYIYYVYKVFGEEQSYLKNSPLIQRRQQTVRYHTGTYKSVSDFEDNERVKRCIDSYLDYSRTMNEMMFDALKDDLQEYIKYIQTIPHTIKKTIKVPHSVLDIEDPDGNRMIVKMLDVEIDIPNTKERMEALKQASDLNDYYNKLLSEVKRDAKSKKSKSRIFEDKEKVGKILINKEFPSAAK